MTARIHSAAAAEEAIRARAYQIWEEEGRPEGRQDSHWQRAVEWFASQPATSPVTAKVASHARAAKAKTAPKKK